MLLKLNLASQEPLYAQIRAQVVAAIASGELEVGERLPSVRALASNLGVNMHTVNRAYAVLRDEGYLTMRSGKGAVVSRPQLDAEAGDDVSERVLVALERAVSEHKAAGGSAEALRMAFEGLVACGYAATQEAAQEEGE